MTSRIATVADFLARNTARVRVRGAERLPRTGPALLAVNHTTIADVPLVLSMLHRAGIHPAAPDAPGHSADCSDHAHVRFLASTDVFASKLIGGLAEEAGYIPVVLGGDLRALEAYAAAREALERHEIVGIYPEGVVTAPDDGAPRRLRSGAARLALATGVPIVPIAHHDARAIASGSVQRSLAGAVTAIWRRPQVAMVVGHTIEPASYAGMSALELTALLRERLTATWREAADMLAAMRRGSVSPPHS
jgi:1-acyl-sn-glycerol-3-phosphate acyltransferase